MICAGHSMLFMMGELPAISGRLNAPGASWVMGGQGRAIDFRDGGNCYEMSFSRTDLRSFLTAMATGTGGRVSRCAGSPTPRPQQRQDHVRHSCHNPLSPSPCTVGGSRSTTERTPRLSEGERQLRGTPPGLRAAAQVRRGGTVPVRSVPTCPGAIPAVPDAMTSGLPVPASTLPRVEPPRPPVCFCRALEVAVKALHEFLPCRVWRCPEMSEQADRIELQSQSYQGRRIPLGLEPENHQEQPLILTTADQPASSRREASTQVGTVQVLDEPGLRRLPARQLAGQRARRWDVEREELGQPGEVPGRVPGGDGHHGQGEMPADHLGDVADRHAFVGDRVQRRSRRRIFLPSDGRGARRRAGARRASGSPRHR